MYHSAHRTHSSPLSPLVESWAPIRSLQAIEAGVGRLVNAYGQWRQRRLAINDLARLDNHLLQDLGIERGRIVEIVDGQLAANRR